MVQVESFGGSISEAAVDVLVVGLGEQAKQQAYFQALDNATGGWLTRALESGELSTKACQCSLVPALAGIRATLLVTVGLGSDDHWEAGQAFRTAAAGVKAAGGRPRTSVLLAGWPDEPQTAAAAVAGSLCGAVGQDLLRAEQKLHPPQRVLWAGIDQAVLSRGEVLGDATNIAKRLVNLPANHIFPETFTDEAQRLADRYGLQLEVWDKAKLEQENCQALLAVARGSVKEPRLLILRHPGAVADRSPLALVGKGVTFDSGGLSLKPADSMATMKCDMAGAASVLAAMVGIARLKLPQPVIGLIGLVENMISGDSYRVGDVIKARSGKTIEILNTDAEGRVVLADVLDVALGEKPARIVDLATLTGACVVALGTDITGAMTNHPDWQAEVQQAAQRAGEYVWPLPMHRFFDEQIASKVADIKNLGEGRWGGAITAAKFLEQFVGETPWVHLDIAGPAFLESPKPWADLGGTGVMVRTLIELAESQR
jgi:leucyl aminopeptidase